MTRPSVCIVTPALAAANNGNWQTASRWAAMLQDDYRVDLAERWSGAPADILLALHARRSADSIARWHLAKPRAPIVLALTGTDLYRDIHVDPAAVQSLERADRIVVLHERAVGDLPERFRDKTLVCFQSTEARPAVMDKPDTSLRALMVGHLREEKDPRTYFAAARLLAPRADIRLDHVGDALDPALGEEARRLAQTAPGYRWLGALPHAEALERIRQAHVLVHPSRMEGGAHVVMEAIRSGTPVLASRISGNVGMLGERYAGYFEAGDAAGLARLIERCRDEAAILGGLREQCAVRSPLFEPARERATLCAAIASVLGPASRAFEQPLRGALSGD